MSEERERRRLGDGGGERAGVWRSSSRPGGSSTSSLVYGGGRSSTARTEPSQATTVQRKAFANVAARGQDLQRAQDRPVYAEPLDYTALYGSAARVQRSTRGAGAAFQRVAVLDAAIDPVHDRARMPDMIQPPVQRRATTSAIDAPRAESLREDRSTIVAEPPATASASSPELDSSKAASLSEDRATIAPETTAAGAQLAPERAERAAARNPMLLERFGIRAAELGTDATADSADFAQAVAGFQAQHGLAVDGIVGLNTAAAVHGGTEPEADAATESSAPADGGDSGARGAGSSLLQMKAGPAAASEDDIHGAAAAGIASGAQPLPHVERIQEAFGSHDVTSVKAHIGGPAAGASAAMGAVAYATGDHVAFDKSPDVHTAAHEAAHVVQQRAGVQLKSGVGQAGDTYEQHADAVADAVVRGDSAEALLGPAPRAHGSAAAVQRKRRAPAKNSQVRGLIKSARSQTEQLFKHRLAGVSAVDKEVDLKSPPALTGSQSSILVECARFALTLATGPIGTLVANALWGSDG